MSDSKQSTESNKDKPKIFLSYARDDDEPFVKRLYEYLTACGFDVWWDRISMPSRNLSFHQEIRDAVADCDRVVLVIGPAAIKSEYVRQEWQFAWYQADKVVTPILRIGEYPIPLNELTLLHCEDFTNDDEFDGHAKKLAKQLSEPIPPLGKLIAVPNLPEHFLARSERLQTIRDALCADLEGPHVIGGATARVGMHGMGGIGKSVLASAVSHDRLTRHAFPDGIVWVSLGSLPNVAEMQRRVHRDLGGNGTFETAHQGKVKLKELLANKAVLLIVDDVWRREDADYFDVLGARCRAMVTTRDAGLLTSLEGTHHVVELLNDEEALRLLANETRVPTDQLPAEATELISECGRLPLAVGLCGALIRRGMKWQSVLEQLRQTRIDRIADRHAVEEHHQSVWHAIHIGVEALAADEKARFLELVVFPSGEATPETAAATLWSHTSQLDNWDSEELLTTLTERSLVQTTKRTADNTKQPRRFWLHDLIFDYARMTVGELKPLHDKLIAAYENRCPDGWHSGPNDGYFFQHLCDHFIAAEQWDALEKLHTNIYFLNAKVAVGLTFDLAGDFSEAVATLPQDRPQRRILRLLNEALRRDIHFIARHAEDYPQALFQSLWNTCWWYDNPAAAIHYDPPEGGWSNGGPCWNQQGPKLYELLKEWRSDLGAGLKKSFFSKGELEKEQQSQYWLRAIRPPVLPLGSAQLAKFTGHTGSVSSVAFSPDGSRIISGAGGFESTDNTVRIWNAESGEQVAQLEGHTKWVVSMAFSPRGSQIVSGSCDKTVRVWDAESGIQLIQFKGHTHSVESVAFSPDGRRIVSGSRDNTVRLWDTVSGKQDAQLEGHTRPVTNVMFSPDGSRIASSSDDHTVRVWDAESGKLIIQFEEHTYAVTNATFSPDGSRIVSVSGGYSSTDYTLRVWETETGEQTAQLKGHTSSVNSVVFSPNGKKIVSGSWDKTVRVWNAESGDQIALLKGHTSSVNSVALNLDGSWIVSGSGGFESIDNTVRIWEMESGKQIAQFEGHSSFVVSVAFSPDDSRIVSGSCDKTVRVWTAEPGEPTAHLKGHTRLVNKVAFSPDGSCIVSGSRDNTVRLWSADTGKQTAQFDGHVRPVTRVAFSADGKRILSDSRGKTIRVWDAESGDCLEIIERSNDARTTPPKKELSYPYRLINRGLETVIESIASGEPVAWFPGSLNDITTHPGGLKWAAVNGNHIFILKLTVR